MIICVSHGKGGTGKTVVATNLASRFDAPILDIDDQHSSVMFNKLRTAKGHKPLTCFTIETLDQVKALFAQYAGEDKPLLIVDCGGHESDVNRFVMVYADILITPVGPSMVELFGLMDYIKVLKELSQTYGRTIQTNVLINKADSRCKGEISDLQEFVTQNSTHLALMDTVIYQRNAYKKCYAAGVSATELNSKSKAAGEINMLVDEIKQAI